MMKKQFDTKSKYPLIQMICIGILVLLIIMPNAFSEVLTENDIKRLNKDYASKLKEIPTEFGTFENVTIEYHELARTVIIRVLQSVNSDEYKRINDNWEMFRKIIFTQHEETCVEGKFWPTLKSKENVSQVIVIHRFYQELTSPEENKELAFAC